MVFVKPSTITNETGAYTYKSGVSSPTTNYIDNNFPNALDRVGGGAVSGPIEFLSGSIFQLDTGTIAAVYTEVDFKNSHAILNFDSGSLLEMDAGSNMELFGNVTLEGSCTVTCISGSNFTGNLAMFDLSLHFTGTGVVFLNSTTAFTVYGSEMTMEDNLPPHYATGQSRQVVQPFCVNSNSSTVVPFFNNSGGASIGSFTVAQTDIYEIPMTKMINGATLSVITFTIGIGGAGPSTYDSTFTLFSQNVNSAGGLPLTTNTLATFTVPTGLPAVSSWSFSVSVTGTPTVDDSNFQYWLEVQGATTGNYYFYPVSLYFTNITKVGQI